MKALIARLTFKFLFLFAGPAFAVSHGTLVPQSKYPSSIAFKLPETSIQGQCSAVKIAPRLFLTAAHCFDHYFREGRRSTIQLFQHEKLSFTNSNLATYRRRIVGTPQIHPEYFPTSGIVNGFRSRWTAEKVDLAIFKINEDIEGVTAARLDMWDITTNDVLAIGGYGNFIAPNDVVSLPSNPFFRSSSSDREDGTCPGVPCPLRMARSKITQITEKQIYLAASRNYPSVNLVGDSGGPAYIDRRGFQYVVGINSMVNGLESASPVTRLGRIDYALPWIHSIQLRLR